MKNTIKDRTLCAIALFFALTFGGAAQSDKNKNSGASDQQTVEGLIRRYRLPYAEQRGDCAMAFNLSCALACARQGSPLIILNKEGDIYIPISDSMLDKDQRGRLMPFVGKYVKITGTIYERAGTRAIVIDQIKEMKMCTSSPTPNSEWEAARTDHKS